MPDSVEPCRCGKESVLIVDLGCFRGCVCYCLEHVPESLRKLAAALPPLAEALKKLVEEEKKT